MAEWDAWNIGLLAIAAYVAVTALVRLMRRRHDELVADLRREFEQEKKRRKKAKQVATAKEGTP